MEPELVIPALTIPVEFGWLADLFTLTPNGVSIFFRFSAYRR